MGASTQMPASAEPFRLPELEEPAVKKSSVVRLTGVPFPNKSEVTYCKVQASQRVSCCLVTTLLGNSQFPAFCPLGQPITREDGLAVIPTQMHATPAYEGFRNGVIFTHIPDSSTSSLPMNTKAIQLPVVHHHAAGAVCHSHESITDIAWTNEAKTRLIAAVCNYLVIIHISAKSASAWSQSELRAEPLVIQYANGERGLAGHSHEIRSVAVHPTHKNVVATVGSNAEVMVWDLDAGKQLFKVIETGGSASSIVWTTPEIIAVATEQGVIHRVHAPTGCMLGKLLMRPGIFDVCCLDEKELLVGHGDGRVNITSGDMPNGMWDPVVSAVDRVDVWASASTTVATVSGYGGASVYSVTREGDEVNLTLYATMSIDIPAGAKHLVYPNLPKQSDTPECVSIFDYPLEPRIHVCLPSLQPGFGQQLIATDSYGMLQVVDMGRLPLVGPKARRILEVDVGESRPDAAAAESRK
jgi:hypothetical protein